MLTEAQKREIDSLVASMQAAGKTKQEIQAAVDSKKAEMLGENTVKEATEIEPKVSATDLQNKQEEIDTLKANFDKGKFTLAQQDLYEKYKRDEPILPEDLDAIQNSEETGFLAEAKNVFVNLFPKAFEDQKYMAGATAVEQLQAEKKLIETAEKQKAETGKYQDWAQEYYAKKAGGIDKVKESILKNEKLITESYIKSDEYQEKMALLGSPEFFDEDGVTYNDIKRVLGAQAPQMLASVLTGSGSTYIQESGNAAMEIANEKAAKRLGISLNDFLKLPKEKKAEEVLKVVKNGEAEIDAASAIGAKNALLDTTSNIITFGTGGLGLMPKSFGKQIIKEGILKTAGKTALGLGASGVGESVTETSQELISGVGIKQAVDPELSSGFVGTALDLINKNPKQFLEVAAQSFIVPGPVQIGQVTFTQGLKGLATEIAALDPESADAILKQVRSEASKKFQEEKNKIYENKDLSKEAKDDAVNDLKEQFDKSWELTDIANSVIKNSKLKDLSGERKKNVFNIIQSNSDDIKRLNDLEKQIAEEGGFEKANIDLLQDYQELAVELQDPANGIMAKALKQRALDLMEKHGFVLADWINSQKEGEFANKQVTTFKTVQEAENYIKKNNAEFLQDTEVQGLLSGDNNAIKINDEAIIVTDNVEANLDAGDITGANAVQHEVMHFMLDGMEDSALFSLVGNIKANLKDSNDISSKDALAFAAEREQQYKQDLNNRKDLTKEQKERILAEEFLTGLSDGFSNIDIKNISLEQGAIFKKIASGIKNIFKSNTSEDLTFKNLNATNTIQFIKKYNKFNKKSKIFKDQDVSKIVNVAAQKSNLKGLLDKYGNKRTLISESLSKTPQGNETFEFTKSEFGQEVGPIVEALTKKLYDPIPEDAKRTVTRSDYKDAMISEIATIIDQEYDPSKQDIDTFATIRAFQRSNRLASKLGIESIEDFGGTGIKTDVTEAKKIAADEEEITANTKKLVDAIGVSNEILNKGKETLDRAIIKAENAIAGKNLTISKKIKERDKAINSVLSQQIEKDLKNQFLKTAKSDVTFDKFLNDNWKEVTSVYLKNTNINKIPEGKGKDILLNWQENFPTKEQVVDYFKGKDLTNKQAVSNRKNRSLANAIIKEISFGLRNEYVKEQSSAALAFEKKTGIPLASKKFSAANVAELNNIAQIKDVKLLQALLDLDITVNNSNRSQKQEAMGTAIQEYKIPSALFEGARLANFARLYEYGKFVNGKFVKISKESGGIKHFKLKSGRWVSSKTEAGKVSSSTEWVAGRGSLYYGVSDPMYKIHLAAAKNNDKLYNLAKIKKVNLQDKKITKDFINKNKNQFNANQDFLQQSMNLLSKATQNGLDLEIASLFIVTGYQASSGWIKIAAPFKAVSKVFEYGDTSKYNKGVKFREEHTIPASVVGSSLIWALKNNKVNETLPYIRKNYYQTQLSKKDDQKLDNANLGSTLPVGTSVLNDPSIRMAYANIDLNTIIDPVTNKTLAEINNIKSESTPDAVSVANSVLTENKVDVVVDNIKPIVLASKKANVDNILLSSIRNVPTENLLNGLNKIKESYKTKNIQKSIQDGYNSVKNFMSIDEWNEFISLAVNEVKVESSNKARLLVYNEAGVAQAQEKVRKESEKLLNNLVGISAEDLTTDEINKRLGVLSKAKAVAMNKKAPKKKARVFDFDDTLAKSKSNVLYLLPDGTTGSLTAAQFAEQSGELAELGAQFDFSEFDTVKKGQKGPLAVLAKRLTEAKGDRDVFVLTARPAAAAESIQSFLRSALGISVPLNNITGLGNGTPGAKAYWMAEKVSEGYNDLFFADDAPKNVAAVNKMLTDLGVKKKVQVAKETETKSLEDEFDTILRSKKPTKGSVFKKFNIYVPPGADDFEGLLYTFLSKGKIGEKQMKFFQDNIMTPFAQGISAYETSKVTLARDYKALRKRYKNKKVLKEKVFDGLYTKEQAVRAYLFNGAGYDLDISKGAVMDLLSVIQGEPKLKAFADDLAGITKLKEGYPPIMPDWLGGSIQTDLANVSNKSQRSDFLTEFIKNKNQIFSDQNMRLILERHGNDFTDALENVLERMETGVNRKKGKDKEFNQALNWLNASVANIMSFNTRSAILQQLSAVNFMNWTFNNPFMMAKAMANVPQFAKDFSTLFGSDFLIERRGGLKIEINTADLANSEPSNWFTKTHKKLLQAGFLPTQYGDSFAIAFGGASWYRNNINRLIKEGASEADAIKQTMVEFQEISEKSQQSSRPDKVSRQQASDIGRLILAFANTPLQYARLTKKAALDLVNGRGDWKTNASKIVYYGVAQNLIFTALQSALFSMFLDDEEEVTEDDEKKLTYALNSVLDGTLRGMGYAGATIAALKNLGMELYDQNQKREKGERVYNGALTLVQKGLSISPPLSKKIGDIVEAQRYQDWRQYKYSPFYQNYAKANYVSGLLNIPADRVFKKLENINAMSTEYNDAWQNVLLGLGWSPYSVDVDLVDLRKKRGEQMGPKPKSSLGFTPLNKKQALEPGVLGKAHKDGTIQVKKGLSEAKKKEVIAHEKKHIADMKSGKLNYDNQNVYWNGKAYPRLQGKKIMYNGVAYLEGHKKLPWEKSANGIKV